jgi:diadenosine tetraphosphate (Ap4A) HIT family hydrolase
VFTDGFPVAPGHTLLIPRRYVASIFDLAPEERTAVWDLVAHIRGALAQALHPDGFNIGINDGTAAGQIVMHAHVHVIPRWTGDIPDPRGGVRWVISAMAVLEGAVVPRTPYQQRIEAVVAGGRHVSGPHKSVHRSRTVREIQQPCSFRC